MVLSPTRLGTTNKVLNHWSQLLMRSIYGFMGRAKRSPSAKE